MYNVRSRNVLRKLICVLCDCCLFLLFYIFFRRSFATMTDDKKDIDVEAELKSIEDNIKQIDKSIERLSSKKKTLLARKKELNIKLQEFASEKLARQDWERSDHPWSQKVNDTLHSVFKMDKFRPHQLATINAAMSQHDCILLMPTGGGKSLCYQLPAMVLPGITLVISPLVSLMEDQIMAMEALNIPAVLLNNNSTREHTNHVHAQMIEKCPSFKLLYVTPEKLAKSKWFMTKLEKMYKMGHFSLLAIDEVHCCSQWGHDFRPDYKFLGIMKRQFPKVPILGLTATATTSVISDVQNILNIQGCLVLKASFNRPNLKYEVTCKSSCQKDNVDEIESLLKNRFHGLNGIIYCFSIKDSEELSIELKNRGIKARTYHAQLDSKSRNAVHKSWSTNIIQVIVATIAFGMGIDKPDVRFVIHYSIPKSMENFYQESGRAGRDDQPASCILFYRFTDIFRQSTMVFTEQKGLEHLYAMVSYCIDLCRCRRAIIADHFGERWDVSDCNNMCDHCDKYSPYSESFEDIFKEYSAISQILEHCNQIDERLTAHKLIDVWLGKGLQKLRPPSHKASLKSREICERIIALLLLDSYLIEEFHFTPYSTISYINIGPRNAPSNGELLLPLPILKVKSSESNETTKTKHSVELKNKISNETKLETKKRKISLSDSYSSCNKKSSTTINSTRKSIASSSRAKKINESCAIGKKSGDQKGDHSLTQKNVKTCSHKNVNLKKNNFSDSDSDIDCEIINCKNKTVSLFVLSDSE